MCNGLNHPSGCDCGFGPPYPGTVEVVESLDWIDEAISNEKSFIRALESLNFDQPTFGRFLQEYQLIRSLPESKETKREKLKDVVDTREYRVESTELMSVNIPLFKLHSPPVKKAKVIYRESEVKDKEKGWFVKVFGIGMGKTKTVKVFYNKFISKRGQCFQIYIPLKLRVQKVDVLRSGVLKSRGIRAEIEAVEEERTLRKRGCQSLPDIECANKSLLGRHDTVDYSLSSHSSAGIIKDTRLISFNTARTVELHLKAFDIWLNPVANITHEQKFKLDFELPSKHDYHLCFNSIGLHWDVT